MATPPPAPAPSDPVRLAPLARQAYPVAPLPVALTSLIGRERDIALLVDLLAQPDVRLLTLVGPGGVGKSRLALAVADAVDHSYEDGVVLVELAAVADPALVPLAIAQAIGVRERNSQALTETLVAALRPRHLLIVLDNLEHLLESTTLIPHLLAACPRLTVLATSRAALHVSGERDVLIGPLSVPQQDQSEQVDAMAASPAVQLFVARAQAVRQDFALTPGNAATIADICRRLDGLPLAIELAAARTRHLPLPTLLKHLDLPLDLLHGGPRDLAPRLRTMRDAIAWSYDLLNEDERAFFRRIAVLAGGGTEEAMAAISSGTGQLAHSLLEGIVALVDMSLLQMSETKAGEARFTMLETIREFGLERLAASGEEHATRAAHAAYYLAWAAEAEPYLIARGSAVWVERLALEWPNLRQAVAWALAQGEIEPVLRLAGTILTLAYARGNPQEGEEWLEAALATGHDADPGARVDALFTASALAQVRGDFAHSVALSETGLALARAHGYHFGQGRALLALGITAEWQGDLDLAARHYEEARELMAASGHLERLPHWTLLPAANLADIALLRDDPMLAASLAEEAVAGWRIVDYVSGALPRPWAQRQRRRARWVIRSVPPATSTKRSPSGLIATTAAASPARWPGSLEWPTVVANMTAPLVSWGPPGASRTRLACAFSPTTCMPNASWRQLAPTSTRMLLPSPGPKGSV